MTSGNGNAGRSGWRRTAWEGVGFDLPPGWDPIVLSPGHLVAGPGGVCGLELKTGSGSPHGVPGDRLLRRLTAAARRFRLSAAPLPQHWGLNPGAFSGYGFSWRRLGRTGEGAVLTCRECNRTHLIQFFFPPVTDVGTVSRSLARLRDHRNGGWREFRIFDMRAAVPPGVTTEGCRFEPGRFELAFSGPEGRFRLLRFGPADMLLKGRTLEAFLDGQGLVPKRGERSDRCGLTDWVAPLPRRRWPGRFGSGWVWLRAAHLPVSNRIVAMAGESRNPPNLGLLESIWSRYGMVAQTAS